MTSDIDGTVTGIQGVAVSSTVPTDGYVLTYVAADSEWEPKPVVSGFTPIHGYQYFENHNITISNNSWNQITFTNTGPSANTSYSSNNIVVDIAGTVKVSAIMALTATNDAGVIAIYQNGSLIGASTGNTSNILTSQILTVEVITTCNSGDTFSTYVYTSGQFGNITFPSCSMTLVAC